LSARCSAIKASGERCKVSVEPPTTLCWAHDPANRETRRRITSKAGKSRGPSRELVAIKQRLSDLADDVVEEKVDKGVAAVASQVLNVYLRALSVELKAREQMELIERLEMLEEGLQANAAQRTNGGNRWRGA
jgi:hypothetical protein